MEALEAALRRRAPDAALGSVSVAARRARLRLPVNTPFPSPAAGDSVVSPL